VILALDAATATVVAGIADRNGRILSERTLPGGRGDVIPGMVASLFQELSIGPDSIGSVLCGVGPGSFTGIRIALSFARGFAFRRELPLGGVSSLDAAISHPSIPRDFPRVALLDALRGEAYVRRMDPEVSTGGEGTDIRVPLDRLRDFLAGDPVVVAEGKPDFLATLPPGWMPLSRFVSAAGILAVRDTASEPLPNYLRASAPEELRGR
jgi:tRNA threonylcarbamoyladenosine biosynthesis protein TsaB